MARPRPAALPSAPSAGIARRRIAAGMTVCVLGLAGSAGTQSDVAAYLTLGGTLWALFGLHQLGRSGPEAREP